MPTRAEDLDAIINANGCQCQDPNSNVNIRNCNRFSWVSRGGLDLLGLAPEPDECPVCGSNGPWQLDHMNPWRQYIVTVGAPHLNIDATHTNYMMPKKFGRALYNDPANLWWLCESCNRKKTDYVYDTADQLDSLSNSQVPSGVKMRGAANLWNIVSPGET